MGSELEERETSTGQLSVWHRVTGLLVFYSVISEHRNHRSMDATEMFPEQRSQSPAVPTCKHPFAPGSG